MVDDRNVIGPYRRRKARWELGISMHPAEIRPVLKALSHDMWDAQQKLRQIIDGPPDYNLSFINELTALNELEARFLFAAEDIGDRAPPGPATRDVYILIGKLAGRLSAIDDGVLDFKQARS